MNHQTLGGAVYLNNIDDYNGVSQSCINPIFTSNSTNESQSHVDRPPSSDNQRVTTKIVRPNTHQRGGSVRSRRSRPRTEMSPSFKNITGDGANYQHSLEPTAMTSANTELKTAPVLSSVSTSNVSDIVTATIADCLACSGCITTAETILLQEQHSLSKLKEHLGLFPKIRTEEMIDVASRQTNEQRLPEYKPTVVTLSPASIADLCRYLLMPEPHESKCEETSVTPTNTSDCSSTQQKEQVLSQLTYVLHRYLNVIAVIDGTVTLYTTLHIAANEYCQTFLENSSEKTSKENTVPKEEVYEQQLLPSIALSSHLTQYWIPPSGNGDDNAKTTTTVEAVDRSKCTRRVQQSLPILSSSCPAIVCLVEKSYPTMVSHLSTTVSPMIAAARQFWNPVVPLLVNDGSTTTYDTATVDDRCKSNRRVEFFHLAVMPCHDKKLEASRNDFRTLNIDDGNPTSPSSSYLPSVDMVITTMELIQLLYDAILLRNKDHSNIHHQQANRTIPGNVMYDIVRRTILSVPITPPNSNENMPNIVDCSELATLLFRRTSKNSFVTLLLQQVQEYTDRNRPYLFSMTKMQVSKSTRLSSPPTRPKLNVTGSGGYADYIFRFAAKHIFGFDCPNDASIWIPIVDEENMNHRHVTNQISSGSADNGTSQRPMRMSVRTASQRKQREYYEAILFQNNHTQQYYVATTVDVSACPRNESTIVLRFVIAYGMPLVQSVLSKLTCTDNDGTVQQGSPKQRFDYIECMACAHSCLNGNGQIRSISDNTVVVRETPSDVKLRVQTTQKYYPIQHNHVTASREDSKSCTNDDSVMNTDTREDLYQNDPSFYTRYHIVPPMQHAMGVAAGISVQDTLW